MPNAFVRRCRTLRLDPSIFSLVAFVLELCPPCPSQYGKPAGLAGEYSTASGGNHPIQGSPRMRCSTSFLTTKGGWLVRTIAVANASFASVGI